MGYKARWACAPYIKAIDGVDSVREVVVLKGCSPGISTSIPVSIKVVDNATAPILRCTLGILKIKYGRLRFLHASWWKTKYKLIGGLGIWLSA